MALFVTSIISVAAWWLYRAESGLFSRLRSQWRTVYYYYSLRMSLVMNLTADSIICGYTVIFVANDTSAWYTERTSDSLTIAVYSAAGFVWTSLHSCDQ